MLSSFILDIFTFVALVSSPLWSIKIFVLSFSCEAVTFSDSSMSVGGVVLSEGEYLDNNVDFVNKFETVVCLISVQRFKFKISGSL